MDSFHEPSSSRQRATLTTPLADVQRHIAALTAERARRGQPLSGRVVHVTHYLPLTAILAPSKDALAPAGAGAGVPSPPLTPPVRPADAGAPPLSPTTAAKDHTQTETESAPSSDDKEGPQWTLNPRAGHSAMVSGILGLAAGAGATEQVVVGWVGDLYRHLPPGASASESASVLSTLDVAAPSPGGDSAPASSAGAAAEGMDPEAGGETLPRGGIAKLPAKGVNESERAALERAVGAYVPPEEYSKDVVEDKKKITFVPVLLDDEVAHGHYDGYCKTTLWPLFHYLLWQDVGSAQPAPAMPWEQYQAANAAYARAVAAILRPGDLVWVHDYHLLLVPALLREELSTNPPAAFTSHPASSPSAIAGLDASAEISTGLFVHTPFPSSEIFRCLPARREVLDGMLGADLVAFQTYAYARHFVSCCVRVCGYESVGGAVGPSPVNSGGAVSEGMGMGIDVQGRVTAVGYCPVGVDAERIERDVLRPGIQPKLAALRALYEGKKIIVARDKLDVVKGVVQKLRAFERLLTDYPEWVGKAVLIQVTSPALTDSPKLERQVAELVAHINGTFGALDFVPVHHYHQTIRKDEFYALLTAADLALITPLRDGMNTTSMEFVIAQAGVGGEKGEGRAPAPLVLSEFMGIAAAMDEALLVNPWDLGGVASAIDRGLRMPSSERLTRHSALLSAVRTHTSHTWAASLVRMLLQRGGAEHTAHATPYLDTRRMMASYRSAGRKKEGKGKRLFLFDYDGTLTPIVKTPSAAVPSADAIRALEALSADPRNVVYIISGRDAVFLEQHWGKLKNLGMSAEHGGFVRTPGGDRWVNLTERLDMSWMSEVEEIFRYYTERTTGSHIEIKKSSITWHYRSADPEWGAFQCRQCQDLLEHNLARKRPIEVLVGKKNLEVRPIAVNKGEIVRKIVWENAGEAEFVFCAGDDKTDEDMFRALAPFAAPTSSTGAGGGKAMIAAPVSATGVSGAGEAVDNTTANSNAVGARELALTPDGVFATTVGASSKKTLASWHVTSPAEVVEAMLALVDEGAQEQEQESKITRPISPLSLPLASASSVSPAPAPAPVPVLAAATATATATSAPSPAPSPVSAAPARAPVASTTSRQTRTRARRWRRAVVAPVAAGVGALAALMGAYVLRRGSGAGVGVGA